MAYSYFKKPAERIKSEIQKSFEPKDSFVTDTGKRNNRGGINETNN